MVGIVASSSLGGGRSDAFRSVGDTKLTPKITLEQAIAAAERNGIDMSRIDLRYVPKDSPLYSPGKAGFTSTFGFSNPKPELNEEGQNVIYIQDAGLISEKEAYVTIVHELGHIADPLAEEADVEAAAQAAGENFIPPEPEPIPPEEP